MKTVVGYKQLKNELLKYKDKKAEVKQTVQKSELQEYKTLQPLCK